MAVCPDCMHDNRPGVLICENCGADLYDSLIERIATRKLQREQTRYLPTDPMSTISHPVVLYVRDSDDPIAIERNGRYTIGRSDPKRPDYKPDIDLGAYDAANKGVSREHISIETQHQQPMVTDLGSANGSFINGQKLTPQKPYPLYSGDELRLGRLILHGFYK